MSEFKISELTLDTVKKNALDYYNRKRLGAQIPDRNEVWCKNYYKDYPEYRCAVAASYPEDFAINHHVTGTYWALLHAEFGITSDLPITPDQLMIREIQTFHDVWATAVREGDGHAAMLEKEFLKLIT